MVTVVAVSFGALVVGLLLSFFLPHDVWKYFLYPIHILVVIPILGMGLARFFGALWWQVFKRDGSIPLSETLAHLVVGGLFIILGLEIVRWMATGNFP